jgi:hypothetical protein
MCVLAYYGWSRSSQILAGLLLWFSALSFSFTDPGGRQLREKKKKKCGRLARTA